MMIRIILTTQGEKVLNADRLKHFLHFFFSKRVLLADLDKLIVYHRQWVGGKCT